MIFNPIVSGGGGSSASFSVIDNRQYKDNLTFPSDGVPGEFVNGTNSSILAPTEFTITGEVSGEIVPQRNVGGKRYYFVMPSENVVLAN